MTKTGEKPGPVATVKSGAVRIPIYWIASRDTYMAKWTEDGRDRRKKGNDLAKLKAHALKAAKAINAGTVDFSTLTRSQRAACEEVVARGITVDQLATLRTVEAVTVQRAAEEFLASKGDVSGGHFRTLQTHSRQLVRKFGKREIGSISTTELDKWLSSDAVRPRTRANKRNSTISLWRWCRDKDYLPQDTRTAAERTDAPSGRRQRREKVTETWSPDELAKIFVGCPEEYLPWVVISSMAGVRTQEIFSDEKSPDRRKEVLQWEHVKLDDDEPRILIPASVSKTAEKRSIPIRPALKEWLLLLRKESGPICSQPSPWRNLKRWKLKSATDFLSEAAGCPWKKNAFRHSYGTYSVILEKSAGAVSLSMGNSERVVKKHYLDVGRTEAEAKDWFSITPTKAKR